MKQDIRTDIRQVGVYFDEFAGTHDPKYAEVSKIIRKLVQSDSHPGFLKNHQFANDKLDKADYGGPFGHQSQSAMAFGAASGHVSGTGAGYSKHHYDGEIYGLKFNLGSAPTIETGAAYGPTAYARMKPTKPTFQGLNAIYELREVPEMLRQRLSSSGLKNISDYWLALKFGWQPLLRDIQSVVHFQRDAQKKLRWLLAHNGKPVRRRVELVNTIDPPSITSGTWPVTQPGFVTQFYNGVPTWKQSITTYDKIWAAARFKYWLPDGPRDIAWKRRMMAYLFGLTPTPQVIWNAIPWSWLADWFSNAGDVLSNLDTGVADRCAADYFYVMREKGIIITYNSDFYLANTNRFEGNHFSLDSVAQATTKSRLRGDPFGFHLSEINLNPMQLSILGALGLSRLL